MFLFETILFYQSAPSYYQVCLQEEKYFFEASPVEYYKHISFPSFYLINTGSTWRVEGDVDQSLVDQAVEDLGRHVDLKKFEPSFS